MKPAARHSPWWRGVFVAAFAVALIAVGAISYVAVGGAGKATNTAPPYAPESDELRVSSEAHPRKPDAGAQSESPPAAQPASPAESPPDLVLALSALSGWGEPLGCSVHVRDRGVGEPWRLAQSEVIAVGEPARLVPLHIPDAGARIRVSGERAATVLLDLRWSGDGKSLELIPASELLRGELDDNLAHPMSRRRIDAPPPSLVRQGAMLPRGSTCPLTLVPLVRVTAWWEDGTGREIPLPFQGADWEASWSLGPTTELSGATVVLDTFGLGLGRLSFDVPAGASVHVQGGTSGVDYWGLSRPAFPMTVPPLVEGLKLPFVLGNAAICGIRVVSSEGTPLDDVWISPATGAVSAFDKVQEPGVHWRVFNRSLKHFDVSAPQHEIQRVDATLLGTDGRVLDVILQRGKPALIVRVEFPDQPAESRKPVSVRVSQRVSTDYSFLEPYDMPLPEDGVLVVPGSPPKVPSARPQSDWYSFELIERDDSSPLPVRKYVAHLKTGVFVTVLNGDKHSWQPGVPVDLHAAKQLAIDNMDPSWLRRGEDDGAIVRIDPGTSRFVALSRGVWRIRGFQRGNPPLHGECTVTVTDNSASVEMAPIGRQQWKLFRIDDATGVCAAPGTILMLGACRLAQIERIRTRAALALPTLGNPVQRPDGFPMNAPLPLSTTDGPVMAVHSRGECYGPDWLEGTVLVIPAQPEQGWYEGQVDATSATIRVRAASWASIVIFEPSSGAEIEASAVLKDSDWYVTIREYINGRELTIVDGEDFKVPATLGRARIAALPPGEYVARYVRAKREEVRDPATGESRGNRIRLEWYDAVRFIAVGGNVTVPLPLNRD